MFKLFDPFGISVSHSRDINLYNDEIDLVDEFDDVFGGEEEMLISDLRLQEARGRISFIEGQPRMNELIRAVEKRLYISMGYTHRNGKKGHRLIEPYAIGRGYKLANGVITKPNKIYIRAFVIMNSEKDKTTKGRFAKTRSVSVSDKSKRWRLFRLDRINSWTEMNKVFSRYRRQYNPSDSQMGSILAALPTEAFPKGENPKIIW